MKKQVVPIFGVIVVAIAIVVAVFINAALAVNEPQISAQCAGGNWVYPVKPANITKKFEKPAQNWLPGHRGIDLAAVDGQDIYAPEAGEISLDRNVAGTPVVVIKHGDLNSTFQPAKGTLSVGSAVKKGEVIGKLDPKNDTANTHCTQERCLHWGVKRGDDYLNPTTFVNCCPVVLIR
jgi:murein DD-endopeptidase MepM/ murein hydrolase activator NlpD